MPLKVALSGAARRARGHLLGAAALVNVACGRPIDDGECRALLDRYTGFLVAEEDPGATPATVAHKQAEARAAAARDPRFAFGSCARRISRQSYECAMGAPNVDSIERCLVF